MVESLRKQDTHIYWTIVRCQEQKQWRSAMWKMIRQEWAIKKCKKVKQPIKIWLHDPHIYIFDRKIAFSQLYGAVGLMEIVVGTFCSAYFFFFSIHSFANACRFSSVFLTIPHVHFFRRNCSHVWKCRWNKRGRIKQHQRPKYYLRPLFATYWIRNNTKSNEKMLAQMRSPCDMYTVVVHVQYSV